MQKGMLRDFQTKRASFPLVWVPSPFRSLWLSQHCIRTNSSEVGALAFLRLHLCMARKADRLIAPVSSRERRCVLLVPLSCSCFSGCRSRWTRFHIRGMAYFCLMFYSNSPLRYRRGHYSFSPCLQ